jgi:tetrahydromethanopterin S-methyltransferase subunit G
MQTKGCARIMAVDAPKRIWSGDRLDGLEEKVDDGFAQVDKRFEKVDEQFKEVDKRFDKVDAGFEKVEGKIESSVKELRGEMGELGKGLREGMNERFDKVDTKFNTLEAKFDKKFDWLIGILLVSVLGILGALIGPNAL